MALLPPSGGANQAIGSDAKPEIHEQTYVELEWAVAWQWEGGCQKEVGHVAQDDGAQSLEQIDEHRGVRHRGHSIWVPVCESGEFPGRAAC